MFNLVKNTRPVEFVILKLIYEFSPLFGIHCTRVAILPNVSTFTLINSDISAPCVDPPGSVLQRNGQTDGAGSPKL